MGMNPSYLSKDEVLKEHLTEEELRTIKKQAEQELKQAENDNGKR